MFNYMIITYGYTKMGQRPFSSTRNKNFIMYKYYYEKLQGSGLKHYDYLQTITHIR